MAIFGADPVVVLEIQSNPEVLERAKAYTELTMPKVGVADKVAGKVSLTTPPGKSISHRGIQLELLGEIRNDEGTVLNRFFSRKQMLQPQGDLAGAYTTDFCFDKLQFPSPTYYGTGANVAYGVEVRVIHRIRDFVHREPFMVLSFDKLPRVLEPTHKEVGIRNILHVEFVFPKTHYDVRECVVGAVYFILVKLRVVHMSMSLYRQETYDGEGDSFSKRTILRTMEIMEGAPVRGDNVPIRFFLGEIDIWPFAEFRGGRLKVEHYLRASMTDENGKQYFKRMALTFGRFAGGEEAP